VKEQLGLKKEEVEAYKKKVSMLEETAEELVDDFKANEELQSRLQSTTSEVKSLKKELEMCKNSHDDDRRDLKKRIDHNKKLTEGYEKLRGENSRLQELQSSLLSEISMLKSDLSAQKEKASMQDRLGMPSNT
jgi:DNA repair exonuclease SbcCD ATPase subunit